MIRKSVKSAKGRDFRKQENIFSGTRDFMIRNSVKSAIMQKLEKSLQQHGKSGLHQIWLTILQLYVRLQKLAHFALSKFAQTGRVKVTKQVKMRSKQSTKPLKIQSNTLKECKEKIALLNV